jgi:hypothetical protein
MSTRSLAWSLVVSSFALAAACGNGNVNLGADCERGFCEDAPPMLGGSDAGEAEASSPEAVLACVGTECPAPYGTCTPAERCAVNFNSDPLNCGGCGLPCRAVGDLNMNVQCVDGQCEYQCRDSLTFGWIPRDCDNLLDNGCETNVFSDTNNCGACGNKCPAGWPCLHGACGCTPPETVCDGKCVDTNFDDKNCGACGNACGPRTDGCDPLPPHTYYGCQLGSCNGPLKCESGWGDCDADGAKGCTANGCETELGSMQNCGACGDTCAADQECITVKVLGGGERHECLDKCEKTGRVRCGEDNACLDVLTDYTNCGACGYQCRGARGNQIDVCDRGSCTVECRTGFADCNGDPGDGCEVELLSNAANCGACGNRCDLGAMQPCVAGKCLMVDCDGGTVTR